MWPFTNSLKCPSYKEINSFIESFSKNCIKPNFFSGCIDYSSHTKCCIYVGDWSIIWAIEVNGYLVYKYVSGLSDRIEICDWEPVLLVLEKIKLKRAEAIAKIKSVM